MDRKIKKAIAVDNYGGVMERLTKKSNNNYYVSDDHIQHEDNRYIGEAVVKLAKFENYYDDLVLKLVELESDMETLRCEGKTNTVKFKQMLANKLTNNNILTALKYYGLK